MSLYLDRIKRLQSKMQQDSLLLLISPVASIRNRDSHYPFRQSSDILYLTGIWEEQFALILTSTGDYHIFCQKKDIDKERWLGKVSGHKQMAKKFTLELAYVHTIAELFTEFDKLLINKKTLYYDFSDGGSRDGKVIQAISKASANARAGKFAPDNIVQSSRLIHEMRLFKDENELAHLRTAAKISTSAHNALLTYTKNLIKEKNKATEFEMKAFIEAEFLRAGANFNAYGSIVASGAAATILHYENNFGTATSTDMVLVDAGCEYQGYASDITRTFPASGKFTSLQEQIYSLVLDAQKVAIKKCKAGNTLGKIHLATVDVLVDGLLELGVFKKFIYKNKDGKKEKLSVSSKEEILEKKYYSLFYMHLTSHYLGLDVHDVGRYYDAPDKHRKLQSGMVFTIEPGLYFPPEYTFLSKELKGIGVRIEDDIHINETGYENLTSAALKEVADITR